MTHRLALPARRNHATQKFRMALISALSLPWRHRLKIDPQPFLCLSCFAL